MYEWLLVDCDAREIQSRDPGKILLWSFLSYRCIQASWNNKSFQISFNETKVMFALAFFILNSWPYIFLVTLFLFTFWDGGERVVLAIEKYGITYWSIKLDPSTVISSPLWEHHKKFTSRTGLHDWLKSKENSSFSVKLMLVPKGGKKQVNGWKKTWTHQSTVRKKFLYVNHWD